MKTTSNEIKAMKLNELNVKLFKVNPIKTSEERRLRLK